MAYNFYFIHHFNIHPFNPALSQGRAWIRMALMEKRLSEYLSVALMEDTVLKRFYERGSFMLGEEAHMLTNVLTALNCVDFSLCLRNSSLDALIVYSVDYAPFLKYPIRFVEYCFIPFGGITVRPRFTGLRFTRTPIYRAKPFFQSITVNRGPTV